MDKYKETILNLIEFAWKNGGIRSPQAGAEMQALAAECLKKGDEIK